MGVARGKCFLFYVTQLVCCFLICTAISDDTCHHRKWTRPGTLMIQVIAAVHESTDDGKCSNTKSDVVIDQLVILDWIVDIFNNTSLIPGHTIGKFMC